MTILSVLPFSLMEGTLSDPPLISAQTSWMSNNLYHITAASFFRSFQWALGSVVWDWTCLPWDKLLHFNVWQLIKHLENNGNRSSQASFSSAEAWSSYTFLLEWISFFLCGGKACSSLHEECKCICKTLAKNYYLQLLLYTTEPFLFASFCLPASTCLWDICLFSPWCSFCCEKCPSFCSFYTFLAHSETNMVPVSAILSPPCSLPPQTCLTAVCFLCCTFGSLTQVSVKKPVTDEWEESWEVSQNDCFLNTASFIVPVSSGGCDELW